MKTSLSRSELKLSAAWYKNCTKPLPYKVAGGAITPATKTCGSTMYWNVLGRVKLLSAAGSTAILFNGIKESWRLARKILFLVLTVMREILTLLAILHLEIAKKPFCCRQRWAT